MTRFLTWQRLSASAIRIVDPSRESRVALAFALAYVVAAIVTAFVVRTWPFPLWGATSLTADATYVIGFKMGLLLVLPAVMIHRAGYHRDDLLLGWRPTPRTLFSLAVAFTIGCAINASLLGAIRAAYAALPPAEAVTRVSLGMVLALCSAALPEEIVFRWGLQTRLERQWGRVAAIGSTALLFTAWHLPTRFLLSSGVEGTAGDAVSVLIGTGMPVLIVGVLFGVAWDRWRNLPVLIVLHWGIDVLPSIASFLRIPPAAG